MIERAMRDAAELLREFASNLPDPEDPVVPELMLNTARHPLDGIMEEIEVRHVGLYQAIVRRGDSAAKAVYHCYENRNPESAAECAAAAKLALEEWAAFLDRWADESIVPNPRVEQMAQRLPDETELKIIRALSRERVAQNLYTLQMTSGVSRGTISKRLPAMVSLGWVVAKPRLGVSITPAGLTTLAQMNGPESA